MNDALPNPFAGRHSRPVQSRLNALKLRTLGVLGAVLLCAVAGLGLLAGPLGRIVAQLYALALGQGTLPPAHVPVAAGEAGLLLPQLAFLGVAAAAVLGHSVGAFGQLKARWVMLPPLVLGLVVVAYAPPTTAWMHLVPSRLERHIMRGRFDEAERALQEAGVPARLQPYAQAQIALRARDEVALRRHGEPVLRMADRYVLGAGDADAALFEPAVVHAIDVALNGEPITEVGIRLQQQGALGRGVDWLALGGRAVAGLALLVAIWPLLRLWNAMRRRVAAIQGAIDGHPDPALAAGAVPAAAEAALPEDERRRVRRRERAHTPVRLISRGRRFAISMLVVGLGFGLYKSGLHHRSSGPAATAGQPATGLKACQFVGDWTASRQDSVFKVTLQADGRFVAEPLARGRYAERAVQGRWQLANGSRLDWTYGEASAVGAGDRNPVLDFSSNGFTLAEVSGETTRYNRMGAAPAGACND